MRKGYRQCGNVGQARKDAQRHKRILCQSLLAVDEEQGAEGAEDNQANHLGRAPGECLPAEIKAQKKHKCQSQDGDAAVPIDCFDTVHDFGLGIVYVQEEEE
jgi:hypothetical protein